MFRIALALAFLALTSCASRSKLACRLVATDAQGAMILRGPWKPAAWHNGPDQCMLKLRTLEFLQNETIGVQMRGPKSEIKALRERWMRESGIRREPVPENKKI